MRRWRITEDDVEGVVRNPLARVASRIAVEHEGYIDDGRLITVITNRSETIVITVSTNEETRGHSRRKRR